MTRSDNGTSGKPAFEGFHGTNDKSVRSTDGFVSPTSYVILEFSRIMPRFKNIREIRVSSVQHIVLSSRRNFRNDKKTPLEEFECFLSSSSAHGWRFNFIGKFRSRPFGVAGRWILLIHGESLFLDLPRFDLSEFSATRACRSENLHGWNASPRGISVLAWTLRREQSSTKRSETRGDQYAKLVPPRSLRSRYRRVNSVSILKRIS